MFATGQQLYTQKATAIQNLADPYSSKHSTDQKRQEVFVDIVTKNLIDSFRVEQSLPADLEESTLFEHFANFCVVSLEYAEEFEVQDLLVAGSNDLQLDGIGVIGRNKGSGLNSIKRDLTL